MWRKFVNWKIKFSEVLQRRPVVCSWMPKGEVGLIDLEEWEAKCKCCGRCCYEKIEFEGDIFYTDIPCEMLDIESHRCTVYAERNQRRPGCVRLTPELAAGGFLPSDCPYVADIDNYQAPISEGE